MQINLAFNKINKDYRILIETGVKLGKLLKSLDRPETQREFVYASKQIVIKILSQRMQKIAGLKVEQKFESMGGTLIFFLVVTVHCPSV